MAKTIEQKSPNDECALKLDVVITAAVRADILRMTLASFTNKFLHQFTVRAIINVDPIGETDRNSQIDMVNICREYFGEVIYRTPATPSYAAAVQWGWQQVETEFFFHLEDDWILKRTVAAQPLLDLFNDANVVCIALNKLDTAKALQYIRDDCGMDIRIVHKHYVVMPSLSLNPSIHRTAYIKEVLDNFDIDDDPAFQFRNTGRAITRTYQTPLFLWALSDDPILIDTGTLWRKKSFVGKFTVDGEPTTWRALKQRTLREHVRRIKQTIRYNRRIRYWRDTYCRPLYPSI